MFVSDIMQSPALWIAPTETLREAMNVMRSHRIRQLPVVENGKLVGIITDRDTKRATPSVLSGDREEYDRILDQTHVQQFMTREPLTVTAETPVKAAVKIFITQKVGALPVINNGSVIGIVSQIDALRAFYNIL